MTTPASTLLRQVEHRPFPLPSTPWVQQQTWNDFLFCHWPVPVADIRAVVPPELELDLWKGQAWLGIIPFHMTGVTLRHLPNIPGFSAFPELNVRTYVQVGGCPGVHFLSLEAHNALAVAIARAWYGLPYFRARMSWAWEGDWLTYQSHRTHRGAPPATYRARYRGRGAVWHAEPRTFEHWLTERYALFLVDGKRRPWRTDVHHLPWPLQDAELEIEENSMAKSHGLALPDTPPHVLFSKGVDVLAWGPERVRQSA